MAFKKIDDKNTLPTPIDGLLFNVNNGDLEALKSIKEKWHFKSESEVMRFALAVLKQTENGIVYIDKNGTKVGLTPNEDLVDKT